MPPPMTPGPSSNPNIQELVRALSPALANAIIPSLRDEIQSLAPAIAAQTLRIMLAFNLDEDERDRSPVENKGPPQAEKQGKVVAGRDTIISDDEILRRARVLETRHIEEEGGGSTTVEIESNGTYGGWRAEGTD